MRYFITAIILTYFFGSINYSQDKISSTFHPFSNAIAFTGEIGGTLAYTDFTIPDLDFFGRGCIEYYFPSKSIHAFGIKFLGGGGFISAEHEGTERTFPPPAPDFRTSIFFLGGGLTYAINFGNGVLYGSAAVSYLLFDPRDKDGNFLPNNRQRIYDPNGVTYGGELGLRFPLAKMLSLNLGIKLNITNTDYLDDIQKGLNTDAFASGFVGISFYVGTEKDDDNDGVENNKDICPDTDPEIFVDEFGCPVDSDRDGVPDYRDLCNNTPKNIIIDENGCPVDSDKDGIADYLDKCPDTAPNLMVNEYGCSQEQLSENLSIEIGSDSVAKIPESDLLQLGYNQKKDKHIADMFFTDGKLYCFHVSSFNEKSLAEEEANYFRKKGHIVHIVEAIPFNDGKMWYRVRIGYFKSFADAIAYKNRYFK